MKSRGAAARVFRAVADPTRRAMIERLRGAERSVTELSRPFRMSQPAVSQHLRVLREAGLVRERQAGRRRLYRLEPGPLHGVQEWVAKQIRDPFGRVWSLGPVALHWRGKPPELGV
jgi:DNA-binding transcriptional ArsR family regulator